ncbi:hypothetical protein B0H17DRAFT_1215005 [Mycena rosella]|uniref:Uncharacterized protein n=1 Tax=Mycena rosella TaxID=1033263 RepID=A0AAD7CLU0_MYCRO|nr:hypothetical protein B0H17DRAFT_1215005 [Mycena rosella]
MEILLRDIRDKPAVFFHRAVRHLSLNSRPETETIIAACTDVINLRATANLGPYERFLGDLPLRYLTLTLDFRVSFSHSMFRYVTHLEVLDARADHDWTSLPLISNLTHFAFCNSELFAALKPLLLQCPLLECVVFHHTGPLEEDELIVLGLPDDVRVVTFNDVDWHGDWLRGAYKGDNFWALADRLVASRHAEQVQRKTHLAHVLSVLDTTSVAYGIPSQLLILLAPLLINAFLYVLMNRIVYFFPSEKHVRGISAQRLSFPFVVQGGGTLISNDTPKIAVLGIDIYMGGIGLQQFFVLGFLGLVVRFYYKMNRMGGSKEWKRPLYTMYVLLTLITVRIVFRLIEFSSGVTMHEAPFYCLEATPIRLVTKGEKLKRNKGGEKELLEEPDLRLVSTAIPPF